MEKLRQPGFFPRRSCTWSYDVEKAIYLHNKHERNSIKSIFVVDISGMNWPNASNPASAILVVAGV